MKVPSLPARHNESHKGNYGRVILVGGSVGMCGAIGLSGMATLRSGAGLVTIATSSSAQRIVATYHPCYMTTALPEDEQGRISIRAISRLRELAESATLVAIGPGLGRSEELVQVTTTLLRELTCPVVVDADAINAVSQSLEALHDGVAPRVVTPHPGEFQRLMGNSFHSRDEMEDAAHVFAREHEIVIVLKGHRTFVTDGEQAYRNQTGNPGMATAGAGDVLTGVLSGLIAQGMSTWDAAVLSVYLHGLAGDLAVEELGEASLIASDLIDYLPAALVKKGQMDGA